MFDKDAIARQAAHNVNADRASSPFLKSSPDYFVSTKLIKDGSLCTTPASELEALRLKGWVQTTQSLQMYPVGTWFLLIKVCIHDIQTVYTSKKENYLVVEDIHTKAPHSYPFSFFVLGDPEVELV